MKNTKVALITGGTAGIGLACARALLESGARVVICGRDEDRGKAAETELKDLGDIKFVPADVGDPESCERLVSTTVDVFGGLDIAVNNAAHLPPQSFLGTEPG